MKIARNLVLALGLASTLALGAGTASADHTTKDLCTGVAEVDGCWYCARQSSGTGSDPTNCHYGYTNYSWQRCGVWVSNNCVLGAF